MPDTRGRQVLGARPRIEVVEGVASGAVGSWVGESKAVPVSRIALFGDSMEPMKCAGLTVVSNELLEAGGRVASDLWERHLTLAIIGTIDEAFIDPANSGSSTMPASVTNGTPTSSSSADPVTDVRTPVAGFAGNLDSAVIVTDPQTATEIAWFRDTGGGIVSADAGPGWGSLRGIPLITSRACPRDSSGGLLEMIDPSGIALVSEGGSIYASENATLEMDDALDAETDAPTGMSTAMVSTFQTESTAIRYSVRMNWSVQRAGSVMCLEGCSY